VLGPHMAHGRTHIGVPQHAGMRRGHLWRIGERRPPKRTVSGQLRRTLSYLQAPP
jgi:hypothetical protein